MSGRRLAVRSDAALPLEDMLRSGVRGRPDVAALASLDGDKLCVLAWHYHDDDLPGPAAAVELEFAGLPQAKGKARLQQFQIDAEHSNAFTAWQRMGSPQQPTVEQRVQLEEAGRLAAMGGSRLLEVESGRGVVRLSLPRQAVTLLVVDLR